MRAQKVRDSGVHSLMVVPIRARRCMLGLALFGRSEEQTPFQEDDLLLAEELVTRAALSLDNALQYARERTAALTLQRDLLPHRVRGGAAIEVASRYVPADMDHGVGGDWFDVIELSGARVALVVGEWWDTASTPRRPWAGSAPRCARSRTSICPPTNC
ncbi:GAF domain-containing protein [Streptomyces sp. TP-A0356]|uniref:GAF domain-containing protein n=1 Tax=Streptomyces sp. TP-A0356 TaxID=1359208 RepID=UPI0006E38241